MTLTCDAGEVLPSIWCWWMVLQEQRIWGNVSLQSKLHKHRGIISGSLPCTTMVASTIIPSQTPWKRLTSYFIEFIQKAKSTSRGIWRGGGHHWCWGGQDSFSHATPPSSAASQLSPCCIETNLWHQLHHPYLAKVPGRVCYQFYLAEEKEAQ
jgi:hypothetical protein